MALKRRSKKKSKHIKSRKFADMLKKVYLNGVIEECLLSVEAGHGTIEAVDMTNSLIVSTNGNIMHKSVNQDFGLGNLDLLIKFLNSIDEKVSIQTSDLYLTLKRKDERRRLEYLLTQPELISTLIYDDEQEKKKDVYEQIIKTATIAADLNHAFIKDFLSYIGILKVKDTIIKFDNNELTFTCGSTDSHKFNLILDSDVETEGEEIETESRINGEHLAKVLGAIDFEDDDPPVIMMSEDGPVIIEHGSAMWAMSSLYETDEESMDENMEN